MLISILNVTFVDMHKRSQGVKANYNGPFASSSFLDNSFTLRYAKLAKSVPLICRYHASVDHLGN
jgi:hypothetical protein